MRQTVVVVGTAGSLGRRVVALTAADPEVGRVIALDPRAVAPGGPSVVEARRLFVGDPALKEALTEADAVVHLGPTDELAPDGLPTSGSAEGDLAAARWLLETAEAAGVPHLVVVSSAMVYGAWPNNPVPLTEDAPLRPDPGLPHAVARAQIERQASEWRAARPDATVAVLRPTVSVAAESAEWLSDSPWSAAATRLLGTDRPSQFLHLDDLATAIDHARREHLDGAFNVAPDGWLPADDLADLAGPIGRLHLPAGFSGRLVALRHRLDPAGPPEGWSYCEHPWVVANDRLRATGWEPHQRNEEVYVEADPGGPLASMNPRRRQELSLVAVAAAAVGLAVGVGLLVRRHRRRR